MALPHRQDLTPQIKLLLDRIVGTVGTSGEPDLHRHLAVTVELDLHDHLAQLAGIVELVRLHLAEAQVLAQEAKVQHVKGKHYDID
ncbi:MAG: hypothetical protein ACJAQ5_000764 [Flavobacteriales bacterium]|jgi:hypothetical protein